MTTFEITIIALLAAIVVLLGFIAFCVWNHYRDVELSNFMSRKKLDTLIPTPLQVWVSRLTQRIRLATSIQSYIMDLKKQAGLMVEVILNRNTNINGSR